MNDKPMGSTIKETGPMLFKIHAIAEVPIVKVEIVKDGVNYKTLKPNEEEVNWEFTESVASSGSYYVRIIRQDEELAWSSSVWVEA